MARPILSEWNERELIYVEPTQVSKSFGYLNGTRGRTPETLQHQANARDRVAQADGEPAAERKEFSDPDTASATIKEMAKTFGAEMVGITHVDQHHVYKGEDVPHKFAIVIAVAMDYDKIKQTPNLDSSEEIMRIYDTTGRIVTDLAKYIRSRGYSARAHTLRFEQLSMLPHAYAAGLGELGKHGSLINLTLGSSFRVAVVTTDLPMTEDAPRLEGLDDFCTTCQMCVKYCPGDAISNEKQEVRGVLKWVVDTEACIPYWGSYYACGICLEVCPVNARAFEGRFKDTFVKTIKSINLQEWRAELKAGLQQPWSYIDRPTEFPEGWRMRVKPRMATAPESLGEPDRGVVKNAEDVSDIEGRTPAGTSKC